VFETIDLKARYILLARLDLGYLTFKDIGKRLNLSEADARDSFSRSLSKVWQKTQGEIQEAYPLYLIKDSLAARTDAARKSPEYAAAMRIRFEDPKLKQKLSQAQLKRFQDPEQMITIWKTKRRKRPKPPKIPEEVERDADKQARFIAKGIAALELSRTRDNSEFMMPQLTEIYLRQKPSHLPKNGEIDNIKTIGILIKDPKIKQRFVHMICEKHPEVKTALDNFGINNTAFTAALWNYSLEKGLVDFSLSHKALDEVELQSLSDYFRHGVRTKKTDLTVNSFYAAAIGLLG
jgi:hypothetical protein